MQPPWKGAAAGTVVGVLLAAGHGARFDASARRHKLLEPFPPGSAGASPLVVAAARRLLAAVPVLAVARPVPHGAHAAADPERTAQLRRIQDVLADAGCRVVSYTNTDEGRSNEDPSGTAAVEGTGASIACAVRASPAAGGWIIALGDMPGIDPATILAVREALRGGAHTAAPTFRGRRGHPVAFGAECGPELARLQGDEGARSILQRHPPLLIEVDDPGILFDVDRPQDLAAARGAAAGGHGPRDS